MPKLATKRLTQRQVDELMPPRRGYYEKADGVVYGLRLRVSASCRKSYILSANRRRKLVGHHPAVTLDEARRLAIAARESGDPVGYLGGTEDARLRFSDLAQEYIKRGLVQRHGPQAGQPLRSAARYESVICNRLLPAWGSRPVETLRKLDATTLTNEIMDNSGSGAAQLTHRIYMRIFQWALGRGLIAAHPFQGLEPPAPKVLRSRVLSQAELASIWVASYELADSQGTFYRLLVLTGQRLAEVAGMQWSEIEGEVWTIPGERAKNGLPSEVPLSSLALAEIEALAAHKGNEGDFVFSTTGGARPIGAFNKLKRRMDSLSKVDGWRNHDIRRTLRTGLAELGVVEVVAEKILNHSPRDSLVKTYDRHQYFDEKRDALERWAQRVREISSPTPSNLTKLRAAR